MKLKRWLKAAVLTILSAGICAAIAACYGVIDDDDYGDDDSADDDSAG